MRTVETHPSLLARFAAVAIRGYQELISPTLGRNCRFQPTCSSYTLEAVTVHGFFRGTWMGIRRVGRCQPFHEGGYDPVPEKR